MLTCKEATELVSESLDGPLTFRQRLDLKFHLLMCRFCSRYRRQILLIRKAIRQMARQEGDSAAAPDVSLSAEARERIKHTIEKNAAKLE